MSHVTSVGVHCTLCAACKLLLHAMYPKLRSLHLVSASDAPALHMVCGGQVPWWTATQHGLQNCPSEPARCACTAEVCRLCWNCQAWKLVPWWAGVDALILATPLQPALASTRNLPLRGSGATRTW